MNKKALVALALFALAFWVKGETKPAAKTPG